MSSTATSRNRVRVRPRAGHPGSGLQYVTPELEAIEQANTEGQATLREAEAPQRQLVTKETRTAYSVQAAADRAEEHSLVIERDTAEGKTLHYHDRALRIAGMIAPWADALGLWAFIAFVLDVNLLRPPRRPVPVAVVVGSHRRPRLRRGRRVPRPARRS